MQPFRLIAFSFGVLTLGFTGLATTNAADTARGSASTNPVDPVAALFGDPVVARGQGVEIRRSEVDRAFIALKANLSMRGQTIPEGLRRLREAQLLEQLIINRLMSQRATEEDKQRGKEIADRLLAEAKKEFPSEAAFARRIKVLGLTVANFRERIERQALADAVIDRELKAKHTITDAEVRAFYDSGTDVLVRAMEEAVQKMANDPDTTLSQLTNAREQISKLRKANLARLEQPESVRVLHIFKLTKDRNTEMDLPESQIRAKRKQMERLLIRARNGEDFAKLVLENSEDQALKQTKGEYVLTRKDPFVPEFKAAAFSLRTNQISDVVVTPYGLHIIKLLERIPAKKVEFAKASEEIRDFLLQQEVQKELPEFFARVRKEANVEILDPKYVIKTPQAPGAKGPG